MTEIADLRHGFLRYGVYPEGARGLARWAFQMVIQVPLTVDRNACSALSRATARIAARNMDTVTLLSFTDDPVKSLGLLVVIVGLLKALCTMQYVQYSTYE